MRRFVIMTIAIALSVNAISQEKEDIGPDYPAIEKTVNDPNSIFYYPPLFSRYKNNDTTLSFREYKMLYYGSFFRDELSNTEGASIYIIEDSLNKIFSLKEPGTKDWEQVIQLSERYLDKFPFDLKKLNLVYFACKQTGNRVLQRESVDKIKKLAHVILSSGDGLSETSALHVIQISDEYSIINMLGYEYNGQRELRGDRCDYLNLKENEDRVQGLYFDLKQLFIQYQKKMNGSQAGK